ncbi:MAG TPA: DUF3617 family protein, partial [Caulobacteraceae bacterium]
VAFAALALAACSKPAPAPAPAASASPAPQARQETLGPEIPVDQLPAIKAGLWETTQTRAGKPPRVERACEDGRRKPVTMSRGCAKVSLHRSLLGAYVYEAQCGEGAMSAHLLVRAKGDFQDSYAADITSTIKMSGGPDLVDTSHTEGRYIGACPSGMTAGQ